MGNISKAERERRAAALAETAQVNQDEADAVEQAVELDAVGASEVPEPVTNAAQEPDLSGLVKVAKDGDVLHVNPCALVQHKHLGWVEV